jgi:hypothetical protein
MRRIPLWNAGCAVGLLLLATGWSLGQTLKLRPPAGQNAEPEKADKDVAPQIVESPLVTVPMSVPSGTSIKVALNSEIRIRQVRTVHSWQDHRARLCLRQVAHSCRHSGERKSLGD